MKGNKLYKAALIEAQKENPDNNLVLDLLKQAINKGNAQASYALGTWYLHGVNVEKNIRKAFNLIKYAAKFKLPDTCYDIAICYETGQGANENRKKAFEYYLIAALGGDKQSVYEVGRCYYYGIGIDKNINIGRIWLDRAYKLGINS